MLPKQLKDKFTYMHLYYTCMHALTTAYFYVTV